MAKKDEDAAKAQGFKRGLAGKTDSAGILQGWTDDKASGLARNQGFVEGGRKRARNVAEKKAADKRKG